MMNNESDLILVMTGILILKKIMVFHLQFVILSFHLFQGFDSFFFYLILFILILEIILFNFLIFYISFLIIIFVIYIFLIISLLFGFKGLFKFCLFIFSFDVLFPKFIEENNVELEVPIESFEPNEFDV